MSAVVLFAENAGRVVKIAASPAKSFGLIGVPDWPLVSGQTTTVAIITSLAETQRVNAQITHHFGDRVYADVFGNRIGTLTLSGLAFGRSCEDNASGLHRLRQWYEQNRMSVIRTPLMVTLGPQTISAYLLGMTITTSNIEQLVHQFQLSLLVPPSPVTIGTGANPALAAQLAKQP